MVGWRWGTACLVAGADAAAPCLRLIDNRAQGDPLVDANRVADAGGLADDDARAVIDEEGRADGGTGVDVDAGARVGVLGHHAGHEQRPSRSKRWAAR